MPTPSTQTALPSTTNRERVLLDRESIRRARQDAQRRLFFEMLNTPIGKVIAAVFVLGWIFIWSLALLAGIPHPDLVQRSLAFLFTGVSATTMWMGIPGMYALYSHNKKRRNTGLFWADAISIGCIFFGIVLLGSIFIRFYEMSMNNLLVSLNVLIFTGLFWLVTRFVITPRLEKKLRGIRGVMDLVPNRTRDTRPFCVLTILFLAITTIFVLSDLLGVMTSTITPFQLVSIGIFSISLGLWMYRGVNKLNAYRSSPDYKPREHAIKIALFALGVGAAYTFAFSVMIPIHHPVYLPLFLIYTLMGVAIFIIVGVRACLKKKQPTARHVQETETASSIELQPLVGIEQRLAQAAQAAPQLAEKKQEVKQDGALPGADERALFAAEEDGGGVLSNSAMVSESEEDQEERALLPQTRQRLQAHAGASARVKFEAASSSEGYEHAAGVSAGV